MLLKNASEKRAPFKLRMAYTCRAQKNEKFPNSNSGEKSG
jgi:hypothetical protein